MTREELIRNLKYTMKKHKNDIVNTFDTNISVMCKDILDYLEQEPCDDAVSRKDAIKALQNVVCESMAIKSRMVGAIEELPSVTQKPIECEDAISREAAITIAGTHTLTVDETVKALEQLPSVTQKSGKCKDCKWWKDSDGVHRRGIGAESQCPINRREVLEGNGYCYMYEPQESED